MAVAIRRLISLQGALFWMNVNLELMAIESHSLRRMRKHLEANPSSPDDIVADVDLLVIELERVGKRLAHWENVVASIRSGRR